MKAKIVYELKGALYINLTNKCCNDCEFCLRRNGAGVTDNMLWLTDEPTAGEVIDAIKKADFDYSEAVFCGYGESTYKMDELCAVANYLRSIGKSVRLNTNGLGNLINGSDIVPKLRKCVDIVSVSLNEADAVSYDKLCRPVYGTDAFNAILDFAKACSDSGIKTVMTVVDVIGAEKIEKCRDIAASVGAQLRVRKLIVDNISYS